MKWDMELHQMLRISQGKQNLSGNTCENGGPKEYIKISIQRVINIIKRIIQVFKKKLITYSGQKQNKKGGE